MTSSLTSSLPTAIHPQGLNVVSVSAGGSHTAIVTADGAVYTCGLNEHAQLGHSPDAGYVPILHPVAGLPPHDKVVSVSAGHHHTVCVTEGGELWAWGRNDTSQCGLGADAPSVVALPAWISGASPGTPGNAGGVISVAAGPRHNLAVTDNGAVYTWGEGKEGVLGHGADESWRWGFWMGDTVEPAPRLVRGLAESGVEVASAAAGLAHSVCVDRTGHVHAWGQGRFNQLGMGAKNAPAFTTTPTRVPALGRIRQLSAGGNFTVAVGVDGQMVSWGADGNGELGLGNSNDKRGDVPRPVHNTAKASFLSASAGWRHAAAVSSDGRVWTWGWGGSVGQHGDDADSTGGQLGLRNGQSDFWEPTRVEGLMGKAKAVSCGFNHTVAVLVDP
jgi:alpha-tubulin suppressor-like RCC1 family protein